MEYHYKCVYYSRYYEILQLICILLSLCPIQSWHIHNRNHKTLFNNLLCISTKDHSDRDALSPLSKTSIKLPLSSSSPSSMNLMPRKRYLLSKQRNIDDNDDNIDDIDDDIDDDGDDDKSYLHDDIYTDDIQLVGKVNREKQEDLPLSVDDEAKVSNRLAVKFLRDELKLDDKILAAIIKYHPALLYLKVDTNLRPKIEFMKQYGFTYADIRHIIQNAPTFLNTNLQWTLPEKLLTIQKLFCIPRSALVEVVTTCPWLLTLSIERNTKMAKYLNFLGFEGDRLKKTVLSYPILLMNSIDTLRGVYQLLTEVYGVSHADVKSTLFRYPRLLSVPILKLSPALLNFFHDEFDLNPQTDDMRKFYLRFPEIIQKSISYFLMPNTILIKKFLELEDKDELRAVVVSSPRLLGHNPKTLHKRFMDILYLLTSEPQYIYSSVESNKTLSVISIHDYHINDDPNYDVDNEHLVGDSNMPVDLLEAYALTKPSSSILEEIQALSLLIPSLQIDHNFAIKIIRQHSGLLFFRDEHTRRLLLSVALSLGMTRSELEKVMKISPRVAFSSLDAKIRECLRLLSSYAIIYLNSKEQRDDIADQLNELQQETPDDVYYHENISHDIISALKQRRSDPVRSLVRKLIFYKPQLLVSSLARIEERVADAMIPSTINQFDNYNNTEVTVKPTIPWTLIPQQVLRNPDQHKRWREKQQIKINKQKLRADTIATNLIVKDWKMKKSDIILLPSNDDEL